jgi:ABC-type uncharacterized transport system substrate-binding protein
MRRRDFITLLSSTAVWPLVARAQQPGRVYRLGFLIPAGRETAAVAAFFDELRLHGFIEGQNLTIVPGSFEGSDERIAEIAIAVVSTAPDAIIAGGELGIRAVQRATQTIPIVGMTEDMVAEGLVASLARPGGNTTGISLLSPELDGKRQEILMEAVPAARRIAALADASIATPQHIASLQAAARERGVELSVFEVTKSEEIVPAIDRVRVWGAEALNVLATPLFLRYRRIIIEHLAAVRLPAIYQWPDMAQEGGFAGYGPRFTEVFRQRARLVVKVLRGSNPGDLPVEQPTKFTLAINLKVAKHMGLTVSPTLLARADEVIE